VKDTKIKNYPTVYKLEIKNKLNDISLKSTENIKIILALTVRNEMEYGEHLIMQLNDVLKLDYDDIVVLDDGSTDGTWDILKQYSNKDNRLHIFRNEQNSILTHGRNRWITLIEKCALYNPTWIHFRACDQLHSKDFNNNLRDIVEFFHVRGARLVKFPLAHLWRSTSWIRYDDVWQKDVENHSRFQLWRFYKDYSYKPHRQRALLHLGGHLPNTWSPYKESVPYNVNLYYRNKKIGGFWRIVALHYGHTTHEKKEQKFRLTMEAAKNGFSIGCPGPEEMPSPSDWIYYNGYKGFYEFNLNLKKVPSFWFENYVEEGVPEIKSFFNVIKEYNFTRAYEYQILYQKHIKDIPILVD